MRNAACVGVWSVTCCEVPKVREQVLQSMAGVRRVHTGCVSRDMKDYELKRLGMIKLAELLAWNTARTVSDMTGISLKRLGELRDEHET